MRWLLEPGGEEKELLSQRTPVRVIRTFLCDTRERGRKQDRGELQEGRAHGDASEEGGGADAGKENRSEGRVILRSARDMRQPRGCAVMRSPYTLTCRRALLTGDLHESGRCDDTADHFRIARGDGPRSH